MASARTATKSAGDSVLEDLRTIEPRVVRRIEELLPMEAELNELRSTAQRLGISIPELPGPSSPRSGAGRRSSSRRTSASDQRNAGRSLPLSPRAEALMQVVIARPGVTVKEAGEALSVDSTGLYRLVRRLEALGRLRKDGLGLHALAFTDDELAP